jgi:hypothetical protein
MKVIPMQIEAIASMEYKNPKHESVWSFCSALENTATHEDAMEASRAVSMLVQALREWSSHRQSARNEYKSLMQTAQNRIDDIDNNLTIWYDMDTDRVKDYNTKAAIQVEIVTTAAYIIGLEGDTLKHLFAIITNLSFKK